MSDNARQGFGDKASAALKVTYHPAHTPAHILIAFYLARLPEVDDRAGWRLHQGQP